MSKSPAERGKELFEKEEAQERATAKKFNPKLLAQETSKIHKVFDKEEGEILYYPLRVEDLDEIDKATSNQERSRLILFKTLSRAYPDLTYEEVKKWPLVKATRILQLIARAEGFLQVPTMSLPGSKRTVRRS